MKIKDLQIDRSGGATHKCMKGKHGGKWIVAGEWWVEANDAKIHWVAGKKSRRDDDQNGRTRNLACAVLPRFKKEEYRIRYYLSSEKLKTVD